MTKTCDSLFWLKKKNEFFLFAAKGIKLRKSNDMVCFVNDYCSNDKDKKMKDQVISVNDLTIEQQDFNDLKLQRIAGGSIIEYAPVFSPNGE